MINPTTFHGLNLQLVADAWNRLLPVGYSVDAETIRQNTTDHPCFDWGCSLANVSDGRVSSFIAVKKSASPHLFTGPDPDQAHITALAFEDPVEMVDTFAQVKASLRQRGVYRIVFGMDHGHFFPGVPDDCPTIRNFLEVAGFSIDEVKLQYDVARDLRDYQVPDWVTPALESVEVRRCGSDDADSVRQFLDATFPGRWKFDVMKRIVDDGRPQDVFIMLVDGSVQGFAYTQDSSTPHPIGPGVWHQSMGEKWGSLGPIGIGTAVRGRKLGHAMLGGALAGLHEAGVRQCVIDWTTLLDFYGAHGFEVSRMYRYATLDLSR